MKRTSKKPRANPHPIRFNDAERAQIDKVGEGIGISTSEVVRMAIRFALPKFLSGEVSIKDLTKKTA